MIIKTLGEEGFVNLKILSELVVLVKLVHHQCIFYKKNKNGQ